MLRRDGGCFATRSFLLLLLLTARVGLITAFAASCRVTRYR